MDEAEMMIETHPDSSFSLLKTIDKNSLRSKADKARYALLMSMALDKNYIDTTTFDVLQPAIDYYLKKGTPDQKLRTYYYQGIIFLNQGDRDKALSSFLKGSDISQDIHDSLTLARDYVAQSVIYNQFYDSGTYTNYNLKAAALYKKLCDNNKEFDCLLRALNGASLSGNKLLCDSIVNLLNQFKSLDNDQENNLQSHKLSYLVKFGSDIEVKDILQTHTPSISSPKDMMNMVHIYNKIGDYTNAQHLLDSIKNSNMPFDTIRYLALSVNTVEGIGNYEEALSLYRLYNAKHNVIDLSKFEQKVKSIEEKHQLELKVQVDARKKSLIIWICVSGIIFLILSIVILLLLIRSHKHQKYIAIQQAKTTDLENKQLRSEKELAIQQAKTSELENEKLKSEKELAIQQARNSELENEQLKSEKQLALQQARITDLENEKLKSEKERLSLDNRNLQLERDKKALEAENLSHRVEQLEDESETLKHLMEEKKDLPEEVRDTLKTRMEMLNALLAGYITDNEQLEKPYDIWVKELTDNTEAFMNSNRLAFQASHPKFIKYFEDHNLTVSEINYVCLYAIGLKGKEVGNYMKKRSHVNTSSAIRKKLGIDKYETNIGIYVRKRLKELS